MHVVGDFFTFILVTVWRRNPINLKILFFYLKLKYVNIKNNF
jgi:hypothetical protein